MVVLRWGGGAGGGGTHPPKKDRKGGGNGGFRTVSCTQSGNYPRIIGKGRVSGLAPTPPGLSPYHTTTFRYPWTPRTPHTPYLLDDGLQDRRCDIFTAAACLRGVENAGGSRGILP